MFQTDRNCFQIGRSASFLSGDFRQGWHRAKANMTPVVETVHEIVARAAYQVVERQREFRLVHQTLIVNAKPHQVISRSPRLTLPRSAVTSSPTCSLHRPATHMQADR